VKLRSRAKAPKTDDALRAANAVLRDEIAALHQELSEVQGRCAALVHQLKAPKHPSYKTCKERHPEQLMDDQDDGVWCYSNEHENGPLIYTRRR
jgi:hypothetical protein